MARKVLIADDEPDFVLLMNKRLKSQGYQVIHATDGEEVLQKVRKERPDIIVMDIAMPKIDGNKVERILRLEPATRDIPVIFIAALKKLSNEDGPKPADPKPEDPKPEAPKDDAKKDEKIPQKKDSLPAFVAEDHIVYTKPIDVEDLLKKINVLLTPYDGLVVKFLMADDSAVMRKLMMQTIYKGNVFNMKNSLVLQASSGAEALKLFESDQPHVVVIDAALQKMSGVETVKRIRERDSKIPIFMVLTEAGMDLVKDVVDEGLVDGILMKPLDVNIFEDEMLKTFEKLKQKS